jgi:hypothetical protein
MKHCITAGQIGPWTDIEISSGEFDEIRFAKRHFFKLLGMEEKFEMLVANYLEYAREIFSASPWSLWPGTTTIGSV